MEKECLLTVRYNLNRKTYTIRIYDKTKCVCVLRSTPQGKDFKTHLSIDEVKTMIKEVGTDNSCLFIVKGNLVEL